MGNTRWVTPAALLTSEKHTQGKEDYETKRRGLGHGTGADSAGQFNPLLCQQGRRCEICAGKSWESLQLLSVVITDHHGLGQLIERRHSFLTDPQAGEHHAKGLAPAEGLLVPCWEKAGK